MTAKTRRWAAAAAFAALMVTGASMALAQGDEPQYPAPGGSTFATGMDGWKADDDSGCTTGGLSGLPVCSVANERVDAHQGSLQTTFTSLVNGAGAADGVGGFASGTFAVPSDAQIGAARLTLDRLLSSDAPLVDGGPVADLAVDLVDVTDPAAEQHSVLLDRSLDETDTQWTGETIALPDGTVRAGRTYRLETRSRLSSEQAQALQGSVSVAFDNVGITTTPPPADGRTGAAGQDGAAGATGAPGPAGPAASPTAVPTPTTAPSTTAAATVPSRTPASRPKVNSSEARRLLRVDRLVQVRLTGPFAGQARVRVFCRRRVGARCEGTLKLRTVHRVNTALKKGRRRMRKVTLGTGSYQMPRGRIGYAKVILTAVGQRLLVARGPFAVDALVTVLDQNGRQQILRKRFRATVR